MRYSYRLCWPRSASTRRLCCFSSSSRRRRPLRPRPVRLAVAWPGHCITNESANANLRLPTFLRLPVQLPARRRSRTRSRPSSATSSRRGPRSPATSSGGRRASRRWATKMTSEIAARARLWLLLQPRPDRSVGTARAVGSSESLPCCCRCRRGRPSGA